MSAVHAQRSPAPAERVCSAVRRAQLHANRDVGRHAHQPRRDAPAATCHEASERAGTSSPAPPFWSSGRSPGRRDRPPSQPSAGLRGGGVVSDSVVSAGRSAGSRAARRPRRRRTRRPASARPAWRGRRRPPSHERGAGRLRTARRAGSPPSAATTARPLRVVGAEAVRVVEERVTGALVELELRPPGPTRRRSRARSALASSTGTKSSAVPKCPSTGESTFEKSGLPCGIT